MCTISFMINEPAGNRRRHTQKTVRGLWTGRLPTWCSILFHFYFHSPLKFLWWVFSHLNKGDQVGHAMIIMKRSTRLMSWSPASSTSWWGARKFSLWSQTIDTDHQGVHPWGLDLSCYFHLWECHEVKWTVLPPLRPSIMMFCLHSGLET